MSARAGVIVTGTEVLSGLIADRNGPWLAERLRERGVDHAFTLIVGDRREDLLAALGYGAGLDLLITSGGLGPTADDLTADVVGEFSGREMVLDAGLEERIARILERLTARWPTKLDPEGIRAGNRKQAMIPAGSSVLEPVGTAPGLVVPPGCDGMPTVLVLPGPPRELQPMWEAAQSDPALETALRGATPLSRGIIRMFGIPESELALALRELSLDVSALEITTCLRRGEIEVSTVYEAGATPVYDAFAAALAERFGEFVFSVGEGTIDEQVASLLLGRGWTIATAESCTGGLLAARLTDRPGSSEYVLGGLVVYSNEAKASLAGVDAGLIASVGAVSSEVARELASGARTRVGADVGVGITGVAGPGGGSPEKPVGTVFVCVAGPDGASLDVGLQLPGDREMIRDRSVTLAMHLIRRLALGQSRAMP